MAASFAFVDLSIIQGANISEEKSSEEKEVDGVLHSLPSRAGDGKWKMQKMIMQQKQKCFELETAQGTFLNGRYQEVCDLY